MKRVLGVAAVTLLLAGALWYTLAAQGRRLLATREAALTEGIAQERARVASLQMPVVSAGPAQGGNACAVEDTLAAKLGGTDATVAAATALTEATRAPIADPPSAEAAAALERHAADLVALREALRRSDCNWSIEWERGPEARLPSLLGIRLLGSLLALDARGRLAAGDPAAALERSLETLRFGADVGSQGALIQILIGIQVARTGAATLGAVASAAGAQTDFALAAARLAALEPSLPTIVPGVRGERLALIGLAGFLSRSGVAGLGAGLSWRLLPAALLPPEMVAAQTAEGLEPVFLQMEALGPMRERESWEAASKDVLRRLMGTSALAQQIAPTGVRARLLQASSEATVSVARTALGLEIVRAKARAYPPALDGLAAVGDPLALHPAPLRYERTANGYRVWSVGENGVDDAGAADDIAVVRDRR